MKETKELVKFALDLGEFIEDAVQAVKDKNWGLIMASAPVLLMGAVPAFENVSAVKDEMLNMDAAGRAELKDFIEVEFDLDNDEAEKWTELGLKVAVDLLSLLELVKK